MRKRAKRETLRDLELPAADAHGRAVKAMAPYLDDFQRAANDQTAADFGPGVVRDSVDGARALRRAIKRAVVRKARKGARRG